MSTSLTFSIMKVRPQSVRGTLHWLTATGERVAYVLIPLLGSLAVAFPLMVSLRIAKQSQADVDLLDAVRHRDSRRVSALLAGGADPNVRSMRPGKTSALTIILERCHVLPICRPGPQNLLLTALDLPALEEDDQIPRAKAIVETLVRHGIDINYHDSDGRTALLLASWMAQPDLVDLLLHNGADPNIADGEAGTVLYSLRHQGLSAPDSPERDRAERTIIWLLVRAGAHE